MFLYFGFLFLLGSIYAESFIQGQQLILSISGQYLYPFSCGDIVLVEFCGENQLFICSSGFNGSIIQIVFTNSPDSISNNFIKNPKSLSWIIYLKYSIENIFEIKGNCSPDSSDSVCSSSQFFGNLSIQSNLIYLKESNAPSSSNGGLIASTVILAILLGILLITLLILFFQRDQLLRRMGLQITSKTEYPKFGYNGWRHITERRLDRRQKAANGTFPNQGSFNFESITIQIEEIEQPKVHNSLNQQQAEPITVANKMTQTVETVLSFDMETQTEELISILREPKHGSQNQEVAEFKESQNKLMRANKQKVKRVINKRKVVTLPQSLSKDTSFDGESMQSVQSVQSFQSVQSVQSMQSLQSSNDEGRAYPVEVAPNDPTPVVRQPTVSFQDLVAKCPPTPPPEHRPEDVVDVRESLGIPQFGVGDSREEEVEKVKEKVASSWSRLQLKRSIDSLRSIFGDKRNDKKRASMKEVFYRTTPPPQKRPAPAPPTTSHPPEIFTPESDEDDSDPKKKFSHSSIDSTYIRHIKPRIRSPSETPVASRKNSYRIEEIPHDRSINSPVEDIQNEGVFLETLLNPGVNLFTSHSRISTQGSSRHSEIAVKIEPITDESISGDCVTFSGENYITVSIENLSHMGKSDFEEQVAQHESTFRSPEEYSHSPLDAVRNRVGFATIKEEGQLKEEEEDILSQHSAISEQILKEDVQEIISPVLERAEININPSGSSNESNRFPAYPKYNWDFFLSPIHIAEEVEIDQSIAREIRIVDNQEKKENFGALESWEAPPISEEDPGIDRPIYPNSD